MRRIVHTFKYTGVRPMAALMAPHVAPLREELGADAVFPVPLHWRRRRQRGFNQAEVLADALGWPHPEGRLRRIRYIRTQVGLDDGGRRQNMAGAFRYDGPDLTDQTVLLLDDVVTTGATANECARVLRDYGARRVFVVAFARAGPPDD